MRCKGLFMLVVPGCQHVRETEAFVGRVSRVDVAAPCSWAPHDLGFTAGGIWGYLVQGKVRDLVGAATGGVSGVGACAAAAVCVIHWGGSVDDVFFAVSVVEVRGPQCGGGRCMEGACATRRHRSTGAVTGPDRRGTVHVIGQGYVTVNRLLCLSKSYSSAYFLRVQCHRRDANKL